MELEQMTVYISGPISGRRFINVYNDFSSVENRLLALGFKVVNPLKNGVHFRASHAEHMKADIANECKCHRIYYIRHWRRWFSRGVWMERIVAWAIGLSTLREKELRQMEIEAAGGGEQLKRP